MALGNGTHKLPVKAVLRNVIDKETGDVVSAHLRERVERTHRFPESHI